MPLRWAASRRIEFDENGERAAGAIAYFWLAGTTTPITVYQDAGLSTPHEQDSSGALSGDSVANSIGRWPDVWIPFSDTAYRERVTTATGSLLWDEDNITRLDPVEAASDTVPDEATLQTGHVHFELVNTTKTGFVRLNARTIGSASSGATERANADCEDLFLYLWNNLANGQAAVSGGRGGSAAADWGANKTITLPDFRGAIPFGVDNMGNGSGSYFSGNSFTHGSATTAGSALGENTVSLATGNLPSHTHAITGLTTGSGGGHTHTATTSSDGSHTHTGTTGTGSSHQHTIQTFISTGGSNTGIVRTLAGSSGDNSLSTNAENNHTHAFTSDSNGSHTHTLTTTSDGAHTHTLSGTSDATGSGTAVNNVARAVLGTWYIRL